MELIFDESLQKAQYDEPSDSWDVLRQTPSSKQVQVIDGWEGIITGMNAYKYTTSYLSSYLF